MKICEGFTRTLAHPPLMVFLSALLLLGCGLSGLAWYVRLNDIPNPALSPQWGSLLHQLKGFEFCFNNTLLKRPTQSVYEFNHTYQNAADGNVYTIASLAVKVVIDPNSLPPTEDVLGTNVTHLGFKIPLASLHLLGTFQPLSEGIDTISGVVSDYAANNTTVQGIIPLGKIWSTGECGPSTCPRKELVVCMSLIGPVDAMPPHGPASCSSANTSLYANTTRPAVSEAELIRWMTPIAPDSGVPSCSRGGAVLRVEYALNPLMRAMLSLTERNVANYHLLHTSYFLFVMVLTILAFSVVSRSSKQSLKPRGSRTTNHTPKHSSPTTKNGFTQLNNDSV